MMAGYAAHDTLMKHVVIVKLLRTIWGCDTVVAFTVLIPKEMELMIQHNQSRPIASEVASKAVHIFAARNHQKGMDSNYHRHQLPKGGVPKGSTADFHLRPATVSSLCSLTYQYPQPSISTAVRSVPHNPQLFTMASLTIIGEFRRCVEVDSFRISVSSP